MRKTTLILAGLLCLAGFYPSTHAAGIPDYIRIDCPLRNLAFSILLGEENGDTSPDIIVIDDSGGIHVIPNISDTSFQSEVFTATGVNPKLTVADDFTGDGLTDLCLNDTLFVAGGGGRFSSPRPLGFPKLQTMCSADMNGDGKRDLVAIAGFRCREDWFDPDSPPGSVEIWTCFGNGDGTFRSPVVSDITPVPVADFRYRISAIIDITRDALPDILVNVVDFGCKFPSEVVSGEYVYSSDSEGRFTHTYTIPGVSSPTGILDVNHDQYPDLIFPYPAFDNTNLLYLGKGNGAFAGTHLAIAQYAFALAKINRDVFHDLVYYENEGLRFSLGTNENTFSEEYKIALSLPPFRRDHRGFSSPRHAVSDLNGDQCADFVFARSDSAAVTFILSGRSSLAVENEAIPQTISLLGNYPNPFNPSTNISFTLPAPGKVKLSVYSITGQKVRELLEEYRTPMKHRIVWDGRDDQGNRVSSGVYLSRLEFGGKVYASRMLLLK